MSPFARGLTRVRFHGGTWDGLHDLPKPLLPVFRVPIQQTLPVAIWGEEIPDSVSMPPEDEYHLEQYRDGTGILSWAYRLRRMVR